MAVVGAVISISDDAIMATPEPEIQIEPSGHLLVDDELHIRIRGLQDSQSITVHTVLREEKKSIESCCCFQANREGVVDLYSQPSISGSYTGVSPMGIFWSMVLTPDMRKGTRLMKQTINTPVTAEMSVYNGHMTADVIRNTSRKPILKTVIERWYKGQGVTSVDVIHPRLRGRLYLPKGKGPFPGVLDLYGTPGGIAEHRSALLASRGLASLALPYFMYKDLPEKLKDIELDYFIEAVNWMVHHNQVKGPGIGIIGMSRGADIGFLIAANCPEVRALISVNGCAFNPGMPIKYSKGDIPAVEPDYEKMKLVGGAWAAKEMFKWSKEDLTPVWRYNPKVLSFVSEDDHFIPGENIFFMKEHYPRDKTENFIVQRYPGAGHILEMPYSELCAMAYHRHFGTYIDYGGRPRPHADAQEDAWKKTLDFFHSTLAGPSNGIKSNL